MAYISARISGRDLDILQDLGSSRAECHTGVGCSSIFCSKCAHWIHLKKCSGLKTFVDGPGCQCPRCRGDPGVRPIDGRPFTKVQVGNSEVDVVGRFFYLGDLISASGGCMRKIEVNECKTY